MGEFLSAASLWAPGLVVMLVLTLLSGFFSASETALFYLSHDELRAFRAGRPRERLAAALVADPDRLLTGILFYNLIANLTYFAVSVAVGHRLVRMGQHAAAGIFNAVGLAALLAFGEVIPKSLGVTHRRTLAALVSYPLGLLLRAIDPVMPPLQKMTRVLRRTFFPRLSAEPTLDSSDLERAVEATQHSAEVVRQERQVLHNILDLSEIAIEEVMRPRGTFFTLAPPIRLADLRGSVPPGDFVTVQDTQPDEVRGIVVLTEFSTVPTDHLDSAAEPVVYVPWCANCADVLQMMRDQFCSAASVVNEYGESIGLVTYDDLLDTILSPDPSRVRRVYRREPVVALENGVWQVEGVTTLRYLCRRLGLEYDPDEDAPITVAGLLSEQLEQLPEIDQEIVWRGYRIRVTEVVRPGQFRALMTPEPAA